MGGKKRTIEIKKIENKSWKTVAFSKRRTGLFSKASKLCLLSGEKIAILMTPISSKSNVSFYSFGHSSVDSVVSAFLSNQRPRDHNIETPKELGFWWEDERFANSENPIELSDAMDSISGMLQNLKELQSEAEKNRREREDLKKRKKNVVSHGIHQEFDQNQTLKFQTSSASKADSPSNIEGFIKNNEEENQIVGISSNIMEKDVALHGTNQELDQNQTLNLQSYSTSICNQGDPSSMSFEGSIKNSEPGDQIVAVYDSNMNKNVVLHETYQDQNQTLNLQPYSASNCIQGDPPSRFKEFIKQNKAEDQIEVISDNNMEMDVVLHGTHHQKLDQNQILNFQSCSTRISDNSNGLLENLEGCNKELSLDEIFDFETNNSEGISMDVISTNQNPFSDSDGTVEDGTLVIRREFDEEFLHLSNLDEKQNIASSYNNNNASPRDLDACYNQELDLDQYFDYLKNCEDFLMDDFSTNQNTCFDFEAVEDGGAMVMHKDFDDDNLHFSDFYSMN